MLFYLNVTTTLIANKVQVGNAIVGQQVKWNSTASITRNPDISFQINLSIPTWTDYIIGTNVSYENSTGTTFDVTTLSDTIWDRTAGLFYRWNTTSSTSDTIYYVYFNTTAPTLTIKQDWTQNTSVISNLTHQYIYTEINITNPSAHDYLNVEWSLSCRSGYSCYTPTSGTISSLAAGNSNYINISALGDVLVEVKGPWRQDTTRTTIANKTAYITQQFNITNNDASISFSKVDVTASVTARPGWLCLENITSVTVAPGLT